MVTCRGDAIPVTSMATPVDSYQRFHGQGTLLVMHPNIPALPVLCELLTTLGYAVVEADMAQTLEEQLCKPPIDLVIIGVDAVPEDSYAICRQIKATRSTRDLPVIMVGDRDHLHATQAFESGANDYLSPPFHADEVNARVRSQINSYRRRQQLSQQNALLLDEVRERKQIEAALRQTEAKYRSIFENATEGIFQTTGAGSYLSVNPALAQIYGYASPEELIRTVTDISKQLYVQPKRRDELIAYLHKFEKIVGAESEVYRKDGSKIWVSETIRKVYDDQGEVLYYEGIVHDITERRMMEMELRQQRQQADRLLVNILPYQIAQRLKSGVRTIAESFNEVTVLFADLVDFTAASGQMGPKELVDLLNEVFSTFDRLAEQHHLEKIKTIGDAYMAAGGLPITRPDHVDAVAVMALDMQAAIQRFSRPDGPPFQLRIGINTGPVIAGVIGMRKFAYDLWGDTVNLASRMETTGAAGRIQVTPEVYDRLKGRFVFESRGTIWVKGRGEMETYWLTGRR